jgi:glucose uptake protein GlcU
MERDRDEQRPENHVVHDVAWRICWLSLLFRLFLSGRLVWNSERCKTTEAYGRVAPHHHTLLPQTKAKRRQPHQHMKYFHHETCCGLAAALISAVAFGSFAVPIKASACRKVSVDPLVLQTYKVGVCFATSWIALAFVPFRWSPYGLVSGLLMVPGGSAGFFGVRNAGLAVSQGTWSALKVLVAFAWGLFMFHEPVRSVAGTAVAIACLLLGLIGMSCFASLDHREVDDSAREPLLPRQQDDEKDAGARTAFCGMTYRTLGLMGAVIDGLYGGSVLVPMHYAGLQGLDFLLSFGIGCSTVLAVVWCLRWAVSAIRAQSLVGGWDALPSMHFGRIGIYASAAGLIWSIGNVCSLLSVALLGQGLGYSLVQSQLIVAGLWAVYFYGEIKGRAHVIGWFAFCALTIVSILLLTRQHEHVPVENADAAVPREL